MAFIDLEGLGKTPESVHSIERRYVAVRLVITKSQFKAPRIRPYAIATFIKVWLGCTWHNAGTIFLKGRNYCPGEPAFQMWQFPFGHLLKSEGELAAHGHSFIAPPRLFNERDNNQDTIICPNGNESANKMTYNTSIVGNNIPHNNLSPLYGVYRFRRLT